MLDFSRNFWPSFFLHWVQCVRFFIFFFFSFSFHPRWLLFLPSLRAVFRFFFVFFFFYWVRFLGFFFFWFFHWVLFLAGFSGFSSLSLSFFVLSRGSFFWLGFPGFSSFFLLFIFFLLLGSVSLGTEKQKK